MVVVRGQRSAVQPLDPFELHVVAVELDARSNPAQLEHRGDAVGFLEAHVGDVGYRSTLDLAALAAPREHSMS